MESDLKVGLFRCGSVEEESSADQGRDALNVVFQLYPGKQDLNNNIFSNESQQSFSIIS